MTAETNVPSVTPANKPSVLGKSQTNRKSIFLGRGGIALFVQPRAKKNQPLIPLFGKTAMKETLVSDLT